MILSGSEDNLVYLWDLQTRQVLQTLSGHTGQVLGVEGHNTREWIISASNDQTVKLWANKSS